MADQLFYSIYRNIFLHNVILQHKCNNLELEISVSYLNQYHRYLSKLDCENYNRNIFVPISSDEEADKYLESNYKHLITRLSIVDDIAVSKQQAVLSQLPDNLKSLEQAYGFFGNYGSNLKKLEIDFRFTPIHKDFAQDTLPKNLTSLWINGYNGAIGKDVLPDSLTDLNIVCSNAQQLSNCYSSTNNPLNIYLTITDPIQRPVFLNRKHHFKYLDLTIENVAFEVGDIPDTVQTLSLRGLGELQANVIPASVTDLELSHYNFQFKSGDLPQGLLKLYASQYNQPLEPNVLPSGIIDLSLKSFNHPLVANTLPSSLLELRLHAFDQPLLPNILPNKLESLVLVDHSQTIQCDVLPNSLKQLFVKHTTPFTSSQCFPSSLSKLEIDVFDGTPGFMQLIPESVKTLYLDFVHRSPQHQNITFDGHVSLPQHITSLTLGWSVYTIPSSFLPQSLLRLSIENFETVIQPADETQQSIYPPNLQTLKVVTDYPYPLPLPESLKVLIEGYKLVMITK
ncbi:hypothetical protein CYY_006613 [Polysphondylium violaceum]|uniref:FNIP repeat-containing protein n=1 Tax=Polysphondylium violaceum TaxID=133409 RepID=A0A8J4PZF0_9MYCE|nr:hypothetical protein CYY_006613 [Polysphondylium violaceum]